MTWICLGYLCLGGHFTLVPNECKKIFGKNTTQLYSYLYSYAGVTGVTECLLQIFLMTPQNLNTFFYIYTAFACISFLILMFVYRGQVYYPATKTVSLLAEE